MIGEEVDIIPENLKHSELLLSMADRIDNSRIKVNNEIEFEKGFACWYQPYHFLPREKWGIHIRHSKLMEISFILAKRGLCNETGIESMIEAFFYLYTHTLFHYLVENASTVLEILLQDSSLYFEYLWDHYCESFNTSDCIEESLANYYLYNKATNLNIDKIYLQKILLSQGPGYRDFLRFTGMNFGKGIRIILSQVANRFELQSRPVEQILDYNTPIDKAHGHKIPVWIHIKPLPVHELDPFS
jgi:hypothetical protein